MDDQPRILPETEARASAEGKESFQDELCRRGKESATQIVATRRAVGIEPPTLDYAVALNYLRPVIDDGLNNKLLAEVDATDQPHLRVIVLDDAHALVCSPTDLQSAEHRVIELDFATGQAKAWDFLKSADNAQIVQQMQQAPPDEEEPLSESLASHGAYKQLTNALANYSK